MIHELTYAKCGVARSGIKFANDLGIKLVFYLTDLTPTVFYLYPCDIKKHNFAEFMLHQRNGFCGNYNFES